MKKGLQGIALACFAWCASLAAQASPLDVITWSGWEQSLDGGATWVTAEFGGSMYTPTPGVDIPSLWPAGVGENVVVLFRYILTIPSDLASATLWIAQDDDGSFAVDGFTVFNDTDFFANNYGPFDLTALLGVGTHTLMASVYSTQCCGQGFAAYVSIVPAVVPEPVPFALLSAGVMGLLAVRRRQA